MFDEGAAQAPALPILCLRVRGQKARSEYHETLKGALQDMMLPQRCSTAEGQATLS